MFNPFEIFSLPVSFEQDRSEIEARYLALMKEYHPDMAAEEQKLAYMQKSSAINQAYQTLISDLERAQAIISLNTQADPNVAETSVILDKSFLFEQLQKRDQVDKLKRNFDFDLYQQIDDYCQESKKNTVTKLSTALANAEYQQAQQLVLHLMFIRKLEDELSQISE